MKALVGIGIMALAAMLATGCGESSASSMPETVLHTPSANATTLEHMEYEFACKDALEETYRVEEGEELYSLWQDAGRAMARAGQEGVGDAELEKWVRAYFDAYEVYSRGLYEYQEANPCY